MWSRAISSNVCRSKMIRCTGPPPLSERTVEAGVFARVTRGSGRLHAHQHGVEPGRIAKTLAVRANGETFLLVARGVSFGHVLITALGGSFLGFFLTDAISSISTMALPFLS